LSPPRRRGGPRPGDEEKVRKKAGIRVAGVILAAASVFSLLSCAGKSSLQAEGMNLLVITLDTMRADRLGAYGYTRADTPNLDDLASRGIQFENCYTPVPLTLPAHCSLFTGRYPIAHQVRDNGTYYLGAEENTLAEVLDGLGYKTYAVIASFVLMARFGLDQGFSTYDDSLNPGELLRDFYSEIKADAVHAKFSRWLKRKDERPFFAWVHFYDPHAPYEPPPEYREGRGGDLSDLYDGEVAFTDFYVGKVIRDLEEEGLLEDTLIVVVGDHGEAFGEHLEYGHSVFCYEENIRVPLVFFNRRLFPEHRLIRTRVNLIDVLPTLLELLGAETPPGLNGKSLVPFLAGEEEGKDRPFYIESMYGKESLGWAPLTGIIDGDYKYISLPVPELYDLRNDREEKKNLAASRPETARRLERRLQEIMLGYASPGKEKRRELSEEDRKRLESLGYLSSSGGRAGGELDPKQGIVLQARFNAVNRRIEEKDPDAAEKALREIAAEYPRTPMPQFFELLSKVYEMKSDPAAAIRTWREAVEAFPANRQFKVTLGFRLFQAGRLEEAEKWGRKILQEDPKSSSGHILLGSIAEKKNRLEEARSHFDRALALEPGNALLRVTRAGVLLKLGSREEALRVCREVLESGDLTGEPESAGLLSKVGILLTEMGQLDKALEVLQKASRLNESEPETWNYLGVVHARKKEYDQALEAYERAVALRPTFASAWNNMGAAYLRKHLGDRDPSWMEKAIQAFDRALRNDPELASAYNGRASAFMFGNRVREAVRDWKRALEIRPDFVEVYFNLGITYLELGQKSEAKDILNACKEKFYDRLPPSEKARLDRLISEAR